MREQEAPIILYHCRWWFRERRLAWQSDATPRIRKDCGRRMCKAHFCEAGGCTDPAHKGSRTTIATLPPTVTRAPVKSCWMDGLGWIVDEKKSGWDSAIVAHETGQPLNGLPDIKGSGYSWRRTLFGGAGMHWCAPSMKFGIPPISQICYRMFPNEILSIVEIYWFVEPRFQLYI